MPRATNAPASRKRRARRMTLAKGFRGARHRLFRQATEAVDRAMVMATVHRKLKKAGIKLNRKMLSEIAIGDPDGFKTIVGKAKAALAV